MILAAGVGERMRPLTETTPKPLIEVAGRALLDHAIDAARTGGRIAVNAHYRADQIAAHLATHHPDVTLSLETPEILDALREGRIEVPITGVWQLDQVADRNAGVIRHVDRDHIHRYRAGDRRDLAVDEGRRPIGGVSRVAVCVARRQRCNPRRPPGDPTPSVADRVAPVWSRDLGGKLSAPTSADGKVLVSAVDRHTVYALDLDTGEQLWSFTTGGRVDSPPTSMMSAPSSSARFA